MAAENAHHVGPACVGHLHGHIRWMSCQFLVRRLPHIDLQAHGMHPLGQDLLALPLLAGERRRAQEGLKELKGLLAEALDRLKDLRSRIHGGLFQRRLSDQRAI
jgi:hypothetical protein